MTQDLPDNAAASMASTSRPVGVRLTETSIFASGMPADTRAALSDSRSGLGLPATRFFSVDSTVFVVASTAGSGLSEGRVLALAEESASVPVDGVALLTLGLDAAAGCVDEPPAGVGE